MLRALGDALGVGGSGVVRMLIREAYAKRFGKPAAKRTKPKKR